MENNNTSYNAEIDLGQVRQKLKNYVSGINDWFFDIILFVKKYIIVISVLFIAGASLGFYMDRGTHVYVHKIFVTPNFESVDYLYEQVERLEAKIKEGDTVYVSKLGIKNPKKIGLIEIEPVVDIYDFIDENKPDQSNNKIDLFKILSENGETDKILEDKTTSRNYKNHIITITTTKKFDESELVAPLLKSFNTDPYWLQVQKVYQQNLETKNAENEIMINQINQLLGDYGNSQKGTSGVAFYNDNTNIADLFNLKNMYLRERSRSNLYKIDYQKIVKDRGILLNMKKTSVVGSNKKIIFPLLFLLIFALVMKFAGYYRAQAAKRKIAS